MKTYFNIRYEFDKEEVHAAIDRRLALPGSDYICVADGVIMNTVNRNEDYKKVVNGGMFSICDSSYIPLYIKWIHGARYSQYSGSEIFKDIIKSKKYRMIFLGTQQRILDGLQRNLTKLNPQVADMKFIELPFCSANEFDYAKIAEIVENNKAEIVWIALGAPKQEYFMSKLKSHLDHGVMIAVGAAFKFYSDTSSTRAPEWMVRNHLEFVHRIFQEPKKQIHRCFDIVKTLPGLLYAEYKRKNYKTKTPRVANDNTL